MGSTGRQDLQVVVNHYGESDLLRGTLDSVTSVLPDATVLVLDGRYHGFGDDDCPDTTRGTPAVCSAYPTVEYVVPDASRLPFGSGSGRRPLHAKAEWVWYEQVDADSWALKIDDDERLERFDVDLSDLDRRQKYTVSVTMPSGETPALPRLWVPSEWTFYVDDLCVPRDDYGRDTSFEDLREAVTTYGPEITWANTSERVAGLTRIRNVGDRRSDEYKRRRSQQKGEFETP